MTWMEESDQAPRDFLFAFTCIDDFDESVVDGLA